MAKNISLDSFTYKAEFSGFNEDLMVQDKAGAHYLFHPWRFSDHVQALNRYMQYTENGIYLDTRSLGKEILLINEIDGYSDELVCIALWWASGGIEQYSIKADAEGWMEMDGIMVLIRPLTYGIRQKIFNEAFEIYDGMKRLNIIRFLIEVIYACVLNIMPKNRLIRDLNSLQTRLLVEKAVEINFKDIHSLSPISHSAPEDIQATLRICREIGWTPSKVWKTPAREIDIINTLLDQAGGSVQGYENSGKYDSSGISYHSLSQYPDSVVIKIEDGD